MFKLFRKTQTNDLAQAQTRPARSASPVPAPRLPFAVPNPRQVYETIRRARTQHAGLLLDRGGEDRQFQGSDRQTLATLVRNALRNTTILPTLETQRRLNIVGAVGGRLTVSTGTPEFDDAATDLFRRWARACEFTHGSTLNELLSHVVTALDIGGDVVIVHDYAATGTPPICGSNTLRIFESDELVETDPDAITARFGKTATQSAGKIYDAFGRFVGVVLSTACRGQTQAPADKCIILGRDPMEPPEACPFCYLSAAWRPNAGRGVSPFASSCDVLNDYGDILASEVQAAKLNATLFGAYTNTGSAADANYTPIEDDYAFGDVAQGDSPSGTLDIPVAPNAGALPAESAPPPFPDVVAQSRGIRLDVLPDGYKADIYDTKRPNEKTADFLRAIAGQVASSIGLNETYGTLEPKSSYTAFRGAQLLARPGFVAAQKALERNLCDWIAVRILTQAAQVHAIPRLPVTDLHGSLEWSWPRQEEVDAVQEQTAIKMRIANGDVTLRERFGPNWADRVRQIAAEAQAMKDAGLIHPATETASGNLAAQPTKTPSAKDTQE